MRMAQRVLVIGATGLLGEPVARGLREAGFDVRVMSRDARRARARFPEPFEIAEGDALEAPEVAKVLDGCDAVHVSVDHDREDACVANVVEAARARGLQRITYVSGTTVCQENRWFPLVDRKFRAEQAIRAGGIAHAIFCPGWFMEMLARMVRDGRAILFGRPKRLWHFVALRDFARMVVGSHLHPEVTNRRFYVHGPQAMTVAQALTAYCRILHPEIGAPRSTPYWLMRLIARLTNNVEMRGGLDMVSYLERVGERGDPSEANAILGAPETTLEAWLALRKAAPGG